MKKIISLILGISLLFSAISVFAADYDVNYGVVLDNPIMSEIIKKSLLLSSGDLICPPDEHPYVLLNKDYIAKIKEIKDDPKYSKVYSDQKNLAAADLPQLMSGNYVNNDINHKLIARAFMYAMGEVDASNARKTVDFAIKYSSNPNSYETYSIYRYKDFGNAMQACSLVYDWCHDVMTDDQKASLATNIKNMLYSEEQPRRPDNISSWEDIAGNAVGQPLVYITIAVSAIYDIYPQPYVDVMKKVQGTMADINDEIIAGTFLIVGINKEGFATSLSNEQVIKYSKLFEKEEFYTDKETRQSYWKKFEENLNLMDVF